MVLSAQKDEVAGVVRPTLGSVEHMMHLLALHCLCDAIDYQLFGDPE